MLSLDQYSIILSLGSFGIFVITLFFFMGQYFSGSIRTFLDARLGYFTYIKLIAVFASSATLGALVYQVVYLTPVCSLCWWQRIFMFPIEIILGVALYFQSRKDHITVLIMASIGTFFAAYHYYYHYRGLVLGDSVSLPCSTFGLLPACTESPILTFGLVTIPLMALFVFLTIVMLSLMAHRRRHA